jgi:serine/threonine protein kinase
MPDVPAGYNGGDTSSVQQLTIKLSSDYERLQLENSNYNKVQSGLFSGRFVKKIEFIDSVPSNDRNLDGKVSALVIESGQCDLKTLLSARKGLPLRSRALRDAAVSAGQCIQAVHSSNAVWTDLKTENFVLVNSDAFNKEVSDINGSMGMPGVKGIDLESVVAKGGNPIDYTPEACPPEFAKALMGGYGEDFVLDYSYDMWSLGMMLYELSSGTAYFGKKSPSIVTKLLCADSFEVDVSKVPDVKLRDLIGKCLSLDPKKRPDITGFLLHPYFLTSGFGPISF